MKTMNNNSISLVGRNSSYKVSVIIPVYNEAEVLPEFHTRLQSVLENNAIEYELIYVNDGSKDDSRNILETIRRAHAGISIINLSRNFGKENAMSAGLAAADGDVTILIDSDLQDPPELIPEMISEWKNGADIVNMQRSRRLGESAFKRLTAHIFYRVINCLSEVCVPRDVGDFRLLSRRVVDALNLLPESNRFMKGLFAWVGFNQVTLQYRRDPRAAGTTKWDYWKLWNFAIEGITGFSTTPLKISSYVGLIASLFAFGYAVFFMLKTMIFGESVSGFPTLIICILFLGGLQLLATGIVGEYLGRLFKESKSRPLYIIESHLRSPTLSSGSHMSLHHVPNKENVK